MNQKLKFQSTADKLWKDETGATIPFNRTTTSERLREKKAHAIASKAIALNSELASFKQFMHDTCNEVVEAIRKEHKIKTDSKGNYTWFNFDRTIKVEVNVHNSIRFDETLIEAAKEILMELIDKNINGDAFIKSIVNEAFQTSSGRLDTKRILGLKKHSSRITNKEIKKDWDKAMGLIEKSISRPDSKSYFRVWVKDNSGEYQNIDLNFSNIKL